MHTGRPGTAGPVMALAESLGPVLGILFRHRQAAVRDRDEQIAFPGPVVPRDDLRHPRGFGGYLAGQFQAVRISSPYRLLPCFSLRAHNCSALSASSSARGAL